MTGRVLVGALPLSATLLVPRAVDRAVAEHPGLHVQIIEGTYEALRAALACGDVDMIVGALRPPQGDLTQEALFDDELQVIARADHPLRHKPGIKLADLSGERWVVPRPGTPSRERFEQVFNTAKIDAPPRVIEAGSLAAVRALLLESDRLCIASPHQMHFELQSGVLVALPVSLRDATRRAIGIAMREDAQPTAAVSGLLHQLRTVAREMTHLPLTPRLAG